MNQSLFALIIDGLKYIEPKQNDNSYKEKYGLMNQPKLRRSFLDFLFYFLVLPYSVSQANKPATNSVTSTGASNEPSSSTASNSNPITETPACLSETIHKRFKTNLNLDDGDELEQVFASLIWLKSS